MEHLAKFMEAIEAGDVAALNACVAREPSDLKAPLEWEGGSGFALNYAAFCNQPLVIEYLAAEQRQDVNRQEGIAGNWTPLHHAKHKAAAAAAATLLRLGADPALKNSKGENTEAFCKSEAVQNLDPRYAEAIRQQEQQRREEKAAGAWLRTGPREVTHNYELTDSRCRLVDVFNFETRCWRAITKDMDGGGMSQSVLLFDSLPDTAILRAAFAKLKELGGEGDEEEITGGTVLKKTPGLRSPA